MNPESLDPPMPFVPLPQREPLRLRDGHRLAFWLILNVEWFPFTSALSGEDLEHPDLPNWAARDYGARVGVWRLLEVCRDYGVQPTVALNSKACEAYPSVVEALMEAGAEFLGHNETNVHRLTAMSKDEHDESIHRALEQIESFTGRRPRGWLSAGMQEQWHTLEVLAGAGVDYVADWLNDDQPYWFDLGGPRMISVPYSTEVNDRMAIDRRGLSTEAFAALAMRQFDVLLAEGEDSARVLAMGLHPFLMGLPHRIPMLQGILDHFQAHEGVWWTTGGEIARWFSEATDRHTA